MPKPRPDVTETELAILEVLWDEEPATIRTLTDRLYPDGTASQYATVQSLLERLEGKGYVSRQRSRVPHRFRTKVDRRALIGKRLRDVADSLCAGSMSTLLTSLLEEQDYSGADVDALRELVANLERQRKAGGRGGGKGKA
ncbi:MAG: BlaI/MecI/CopY family transcriptional regulator [Planctomycetota bacterium]